MCISLWRRKVLLASVRVFGAVLIFCLLVFPAPPRAHAQRSADGAAGGDASIDYNQYYQFPLAAGVDISLLNPLNQGDQNISVIDLSGYVRRPLPDNPVLQPTGRAGVMLWNVDDPEQGPERWSHQHFYATLGLGYSNRFTREFEVGLEGGLGAGQTVYPNFDEAGAVGYQNLVASASARLTLAPSYNFGIDLQPGVRYVRRLGGEPMAGGPEYLSASTSFGVGISLNYRFGQDPDADGGIIRSITVNNAEVSNIFPARQSYYFNNPVGTVEFTNSGDQIITDVTVSFNQDRYMDAPSVAGHIDRIRPGERAEVDLVAAFNSDIFNTQGTTPLSGEVVFDYTYRTRGIQQRHSVDFDMYDRNSLSWDETERFAAFVTPADTVITNFGSYALQSTRPHELDGITEPIQTAMSMYYALEELGIDYQRDPVIPFPEAQADPEIVDTVSLGRETLQRSAGECDDLTALYNSLLESTRVESGFVATPGHLYPMFNTEVPSENYRDVHPDPEMTFDIDGELWIPIEITLVNRESFMDAWREGVNVWNRHAHEPEVRERHETRVAQIRYRAVALSRSEMVFDYGDGDNVGALFRNGLDELSGAILADYEALAQERGRARTYNQLGIVAGDLQRYDIAERAFNTALSLDRSFVGAHINIGQLYRLQDRDRQALRSLHRAEEQIEDMGRTASPNYARTLLHIAEIYYELENYDRAREYYVKLEQTDPDMAAEHRYLGRRAGRTSRYSPSAPAGIGSTGASTSAGG